MLERIVAALHDANEHGSIPFAGQADLTGMSGDRVVAVLQRTLQVFADEDACYLEVGTFQGLTLLSVAAAVPETPCYGIDSFVSFDAAGTNRSLVERRRSALGLGNAQVIDMDYEDALSAMGRFLRARKVGVYFIDGPHDYRSQLMCLMKSTPWHHLHAVIVVDDCNYRHVRQANADFLACHGEYKLVFEAYTPRHPNNMAAHELADARSGYWNGINVIVRDVEGRLPRRYPPTDRDRQIYVDEHVTLSNRMSALAPAAVQFADALFHPWRLPKASVRLLHRYLTRGPRGLGLFPDANTYSEHLPRVNFTPSPREGAASKPATGSHHG